MKKKRVKIRPQFDLYEDRPDLENFSERYPKEYRRICLIGAFFLLLPVFVLIAYMGFINRAPNSGFLLLVCFGGFVMGVGLFNIVGAWCGMCFGLRLTALCLFVGGIMVTVGMVMMYVPGIYSRLDEEMVNHYFIQILLSVFMPVGYLSFRSTMGDWMKRRKIGNKRTREKLKEGAKNYWFYQALHEEYGLGMRYYLNKIFLFIAVPATFCVFFFGWCRSLATINAALISSAYVLCAPMSLMASIEDNYTDFGKPFVFGQYRKQKRSTVMDIAIFAWMLAMAYFIVRMTRDLHR